MSSPFPGMDPYLEGSEWSGIHGQLIAEIGRQLTPHLRPRYVARMQKWFAVDSGRAGDAVAVDLTVPAEVYPDVGIIEESRAQAPSATIVAPAPLELQTVMPRLSPQHTLEIRDVANRQLVAAIEVLSNWNKRGEGHKQYRKRRTRFLCSTAHLVEIDLLRRGRRVPMQEPLPAYPYFIFVSRAERRPATQVWPVSLTERLPTVPVPLLAGDADAMLDLQLALTSVYDQLAYDISTDYQRPAEVPLEAADAAWAATRIQAWRASVA